MGACFLRQMTCQVNPPPAPPYVESVIGTASDKQGFFYTWTSENKNARTDQIGIQNSVDGAPQSVQTITVARTPSKASRRRVGTTIGRNGPGSGECAVCADEGNPIDAVTGAKLQTEVDFDGGEAGGISLVREYNSLVSNSISAFGTNWTGTWRRSISALDDGAGLKYSATVQREDGSEITFVYNSTTKTYVSTPDIRYKLNAIPAAGLTQTSWRLTTDDGSVEVYSIRGILSSITSRTGRVTSFGYDPANPARLTTVTGPFGAKMLFSYDATGRVSQMTAPDKGVYKYAYDASGNLISITYPDNSVKTYLYQLAAYPKALTGIKDELGAQYATYTYNASGLAASSEHAGAVDKTTFVYNADGTTTVTDPRGNVHTYTSTTQFGLDKATAIAGAPVQTAGGKAFAYDANGFLSQRTDWNGVVTKYVNDTRGNEISRIEAAGTTAARTISTAWHPTFNLPTKITEPGRVTEFTYDAKGNLLTRKITAGTQTRTWSYTYSAVGQKLTETDPRGNVTTFVYDAQGNLASVRNALGQTTQFTNYDGAGRLLRSVDPNGLVTTFTYDLRGRRTSQTVGALKTTYAYDAAGNLKKVTAPDNSFLSFTYDAAHRLVGVADAVGNRIAYALDAASNKTAETVFTAANVQVRSKTFTYDNVDRVLTAAGVSGPKNSYAYDLEGNLLSDTNALNQKTSYSYDALKRAIGSVNAASGATTLAYDPLDRLTSVKDPKGLTTAYAWDGLDNNISITSPDTGKTTRTFDAAGNVLTSTDARGKITTYAYDALNRKISETRAGGPNVQFQYDQGINGIGRLTTVIDGTGSTAYSYDLNGRVIQKLQTIGTLSWMTRYGYVAGGRLSTVTYPSKTIITYGYDAAGRVISAKAGAQNLLTGATYAPFGGVTGWLQGNGAAYTRTIDPNNRVSAFSVPGRSVTLTYDAGERITATAVNAVAAKTYAYDALARLTSFAAGTIGQTYSYDADGNRLTAALKNGATTSNFTYAFPTTSNRLTSVGGATTETFTYDASGNTLTDAPSYAFTYDDRGRLVSSKIGAVIKSYGVNGLGQRVSKTDAAAPGTNTYFVYDEAGRLIGEYNSTGARLQETVWLGDLPVATLQASGTFFIAPDHLGAPYQITNAARAQVWLWDHDPFGTDAPTGTLAYNLRFPGQYYDTETGLNYNYYRDYNPKLGRYIESDPIGLKGGVNTYVYGMNDPVGRSDRTGLDACLAFSGELPGHMSLIVDNPEGGTRVFEFYPKDGSYSALYGAAVEGEVGEGLYSKASDVPGTKIPGSCRKQNAADDRRTIDRARELANLARNGELKYSALGHVPGSLNCWEFAIIAK